MTVDSSMLAMTRSRPPLRALQSPAASPDLNPCTHRPKPAASPASAIAPSLRIQSRLACRWRPCRKRQLGLVLLRRRALPLSQNPRDDLRLRDAGNDLELAATANAALDLDAKHALKPSRPVHHHMPRGRPLGRISCRHWRLWRAPAPAEPASPQPATDCAGQTRRDTSSSASAAAAPVPPARVPRMPHPAPDMVKRFLDAFAARIALRKSFLTFSKSKAP